MMVLDSGADTAQALCRSAGIAAVCEDAFDDKDGWRACVLDGYEFSDAQINRFASLAPLIVIDDFGHPPANAVLAINPALPSETDAIGKVPALSGPKYALVARRFAETQRGAEPKTVRDILITFGRIDPGNATRLALEATAPLIERGRPLQVTAVVGTQAQADAIRAVGGDAVEILADVDDMAPLLGEADLVVGAGGVSLYERMAAGVPSVSLKIADNQQMLIESSAREGATHFAGDASSVSVSDLADCIEALCADKDRRQRMSDRGRAMIDGRGAERVAEAIMRVTAARQHAPTC